MHCFEIYRASKFEVGLRSSPTVRVKISTKKISISTLTTGYLKNTQTIIFIPLFIFLKYYFLIFFFILFYFFLSLFPPLSLSPVTPHRWVHQNSTSNQLPAKTLSVHSSSLVGSVEFHTQLTSGQNNNKHKLSPKLIKPKFTNQGT
jgi:predicted membrane protein